MKMSDDGLEFLTRHEGCELRVYDDVAGYPTIGVGHLIRDDDPDFSNGITHDEAIELLRKDVGHAEHCVNSYVNVPLTQIQFDTLVSFVFNIGGGAFKDSTLLRLLNQEQYGEVPAQLQRWNRAGGQVVQGLINRRAAESGLWQGETYDV
jgi:lysozyme